VKRLFVFTTLVVLAFAAVGAVWAENDPRIGTWKLNVAKSTSSSGPLPASQTRTYKAQGSGTMAVTETVDEKGNHTSTSYDATADGKDHSTGQANAGTSITIRLLGTGSYAGTSKKDGKVVSTNRAVISQGGKVFTFTTKGTNAQGQAFTSVLVFDKQ
jgi:hypothetical protein